jgi:hypothetical protein
MFIFPAGSALPAGDRKLDGNMHASEDKGAPK